MGRKHILQWTTRAFATGIALLSVASAQEATPTPATEPSNSNEEALPIELDATQEVELSPREMKAAVPEILEEIKEAQQRVSAMLAEAREDGDVSKVLCLDPYAGEIDIAEGAARDRAGELAEALDRGDLTRARFSFNLLTVVKDRVVVVLGQANSCIGEETGFTGDSTVEVEVDPSLPDSDPADTPPVVVTTAEPNVESAAE